MNNIEIRQMCADNYIEICRLAGENLAEAWSEKTFFEQLSNPNDYTIAAYCDGELAGYLDVWYIVGEIDINNIAVAEKFRRCGIASKLLTSMREHFPEAFSCTLEVRESNVGAIELYRKFGFEEVGLRKNFYSEPCESAVIMKITYGAEN